MSILVTGATGTIGTEVLHLLSQRGEAAVKALVHDPGKAAAVAAQGIEPLVGAFEDRRSLDSAMLGTLLHIMPL